MHTDTSHCTSRDLPSISTIVFFPLVLFSLGCNQAPTVQGDSQNSPQTNTALHPAAHSKQTLREVTRVFLSSRTRAQADTTNWYPLFFLIPFLFFPPSFLKKKKKKEKNHLGNTAFLKDRKTHAC